MKELTITIEDLYNFYSEYPEYEGKIDVETRHGYYPVEKCAITAYDSEVMEIITENDNRLLTSPDHLLMDKNCDWKAVREMKEGEILMTRSGAQYIKSLRKMERKRDLYDLQVGTVHEFYANDIVSHNSSIADAFYYAIFGTTLRELSKQYIVNRKTGKDCSVKLEFEVETQNGSNYVVIERCLGPSKLTVWIDDIDKTKSGIPETNKFIKEILEADEDIFQNCILMRANSTVPFMCKKKGERKNFIESIFNLEIFSDMQKLLREDVKEKRRDYDKINAALEVLESQCQSAQRRIDQIEQEEKERETRIQNEKNRILNLISEEEKKLSNIVIPENGQTDNSYNENLQKKKKCEEFRKSVLEKRYSISSEMNSLKKEIIKIDSIGDSCPTCNRPYPEDQTNNNKKLKDEKIKEIMKLKKDYDDNEDNYKKLEQIVQDLDKKIDEVRRLENQKLLLIERQNSIKKTISQYQDALGRVNERFESKSSKMFQDALLEAQDKQKDKVKEQEEVQKVLSKMGICEHILGEAGVRSYIINKLLDLLNNRIRYYLKCFKSSFTFTFNEYFEEEIKDSNGVVCLYNNCSGAEMKKIDMAISFAFVDIIKLHRQINYNVTFYDEILDSSLDNKNLENLIHFISEQNKVNHKAVYIITHKNDITLPEINEIITMEKRGGFTRKLELS